MAFDLDHGVETGRWTLSGYEPTPPHLAKAVLDAQPMPSEGAAFVDVGAGKGRMLFLAARRPYARVVGLELDATLVKVGLRNLREGRDPQRRSIDVQLLHADATRCAWPTEPLVLYLYNPFDAETLEVMLGRVQASLAASPRSCCLAYVNPLYPEPLKARGWRCLASGGIGTGRWAWWTPPERGA